ncbi:MAG: caspase family protein, partial [Bradyrhizobiaceae bacterium]|nr:caspase family protein [Bradyrhizobiaceae bacterium]
MKRVGFGWLVTATMMTLVSAATPALPQNLPPTEPILRIETGTHGAPIWSISLDASCRLMVTGSSDKTARLWALPESGTGEPKLQQVLRVPIGPADNGKVDSVALSPDGRLVAVGGYQGLDNGVYIFDAETGKLLRRLGKLTRVIAHLTFSSDGRYLAATLWGGGGLRVWDTTGWSLVGEDKDYGGKDSHGAAFDTADRLYTVANDGFLRRYGPDFKLEAKSKTVGGADPYSIAVHPKDDRVAVGFDHGLAVEVYETRDLQRLFAADLAGLDRGNFFWSVAWSVDGMRLYGAGGNLVRGGGLLRIWEQEGRVKARDVILSGNTIDELMPCRDVIAVGTQDPAFGLIRTTGEKQIWQEGDKPDMRGKRGNDFTVSADGSQVRFGLGLFSQKPVLFDLIAGRLIDQPSLAAGLAAPDTKTLKVTDWINNGVPKLNGTPLQLTQYETARSVAIAPGGDRFVLGADWNMRAYGTDGKQLWRKPVPGIAWGVNVPRSGKLVVAAYDDGTIRWHRLSDGEEVVALFVNAKTHEWVLWTPQGYYASSIEGDHMVGWHLNKGWEQAGEFVTATRLKKHLYRPDIVKRAFELADADAAVREAGLSGFKLADLASHAPPEFRIVDPRDNTRADKSPVAVKLELSDTDDPVTGFDIKVNGRQVTPRDVRDIDQPTKEAETRTLNIPMEKGENHIQILAHNRVGETVHDLLVYLDREGVLDRKGRLFIVAVGIDKYAKLGDRYTLRYAGADARLMLDTLTKKAGPLHTEVISKLLVSDGDMPPTKGNIEDALAIFRDARPEDTVILFLASHGVNDGPNYLMIPEDAERNDVGRWRPSTIVKWSDLQQALQDAQGSRIMFVDTCHSSGAYSSRLVKDAADANIVVFSATDKDTEAQETSKLGHGVFTYALSEGINGGADFGKKGLVNVLSLGAYVSDEVKRMTN